MREILEEELPDVDDLDLQRGPARDLRARALLDHRRQRRAVAARRRLRARGSSERLTDERLRRRPAAAALRRRRDDAARRSQEFAVRLAASGIAAGAIASRHIAGAVRLPERDRPRHGRHAAPTSRCVYDGELRTTNEWFVEYGHPICFPSIEVLTIGAGGGSLAWIDEAGLAAQRPAVGGRRSRPGVLRQAAARSPRTPTPTSSLGRLGTELVGGEHARSTATRPSSAITDGVGRAARPSTADGGRAPIIAVANANMADAVRLISIRRGYDPRDFALVAFGGAGRAARRRARAGAVDPDRARAAEPRHHRRRSAACWSTSATTCRRCSCAAPTTPTRPRSRRSSRSWRTRRRERLRPRACPTSDVTPPALDRHALPRPVALAGGRRSTPGSIARRRPSRASTTSTSASSPTAATTRRSRSTGSTLQRHRRDAEGRAGRARADRRASCREPDRAPRRCSSTSTTSRVDTPVYERDDLPAGVAFDGPGRDRPARLDRRSSHPASTAEVDEWLNIRMHDRSGGRAHEHDRAHARPRHLRGAQELLRRPSSTRWPSRSCAPATRSSSTRATSPARCATPTATRSCRAARTSPCTSARCTSRPRPCIEAFEGDIHEGDVFAVNDPYLRRHALQRRAHHPARSSTTAR